MVRANLGPPFCPDPEDPPEENSAALLNSRRWLKLFKRVWGREPELKREDDGRKEEMD